MTKKPSTKRQDRKTEFQERKELSSKAREALALAPPGTKILEGELIPLRKPAHRPNNFKNLGPKGFERIGMGRKPGSKNLMTREVKDVIAGCFTDIGGRKAFADWAKLHRTEFYKIYAKLLPIQLQADVTREINIYVTPEEADL